jgi:2-oxoglutarate/2-oxoacid ferredoxin oxidoreductase subunit alpha
MPRTVIKVCGESGMGLRSVGFILTKSLKKLGFYLHANREFPSLIKGGHSSVQVEFGTQPIRSITSETDILLALDWPTLLHFFDTVKKGGVLIHSFERHDRIKDLEKRAKKRGIRLIYIPAHQMLREIGGADFMVNMVLLGFLWGVLGLEFKVLKGAVSKQFASKPKILKLDLKAIKMGYDLDIKENLVEDFQFDMPKKVPNTILLDGNAGVALGAIQCGTRAYYAYPMSPASSILGDLAKWAKQSGMVIKQAEDEITAAQMTLGSMFMGTRALVATSGGGYDLMTETVSLSAITETPLVIVIVQRPGPATGLPTWTGQADLNLAIHGAHGEFATLVVAGSDPSSCYELIQHAMNYAEEFQMPVTFLSEQVVGEALYMVPPLEHKKIPIKRGLVTNKKELSKLIDADRYRLSKNGISKRWIPGSAKAIYDANGDEHWENGDVTEDATKATMMIAKRMKKLETLTKALPEPKVYGSPKNADVSFVGWGSSKNVMLDAIAEAKAQGLSVNYLHFDYLHPLKTKRLIQFFEENNNVCLIEGNFAGQLGEIIEGKTGKQFSKKFLKWNGRAFFIDEVMSFITTT